MTGPHDVQGIAFSELARDFGTPLFVYDGSVITERFGRLRGGLAPSADIFYSLKANPSLAICALLASLGAGAEVSSLGELITAGRAGVPAGDTLFPGPARAKPSWPRAWTPASARSSANRSGS